MLNHSISAGRMTLYTALLKLSRRSYQLFDHLIKFIQIQMTYIHSPCVVRSTLHFHTASDTRQPGNEYAWNELSWHA